MRTEDQIKRKYNELAMRKQALELSALEDSSSPEVLQARIESLEQQMTLLEWVLNAPLGRYHA
jgi:predicted nuclease with TOPRIM domain